MEYFLLDNYKFLGRSPIYSSETEINENTIPKILNGAMARHEKRRLEIEYLERYFRGDQPITRRIKKVRPEVNNKIIVNNAYSIVRSSVGYFLGEPIKYASKTAETRDEVEILNNEMETVDKAYGDSQIGEWQSICGTAFRLVAVSKNSSDKDKYSAPFDIPVLDPRYTDVIYSTEAGNPPILSFVYSDILDDDGNIKGRKYTVYDDTYQYIYNVEGQNNEITPENLAVGYPKEHLLGENPIIEYPNNQWRMGDFEPVLTILNAINKLQSDRVNSVEQLVNAILVFVNCELQSAEESSDGISDLEKLKENLAIAITSKQNQQADIKYVNSQVNQDEAETLAQTLVDYVYAISGIPDRKNKTGGGGDTGDAVQLRNGYEDLEKVTRIKERYFRKSEKALLNIVCRIIRQFRHVDIRSSHVEPKFIRNRTNNLLNKAQAMATLQAMKVLDPVDIITLGGVSDNPIDMVKRGLDYYASETKTGEKTNQTIPEENLVLE